MRAKIRNNMDYRKFSAVYSTKVSGISKKSLQPGKTELKIVVRPFIMSISATPTFQQNLKVFSRVSPSFQQTFALAFRQITRKILTPLARLKDITKRLSLVPQKCSPSFPRFALKLLKISHNSRTSIWRYRSMAKVWRLLADSTSYREGESR